MIKQVVNRMGNLRGLLLLFMSSILFFSCSSDDDNSDDFFFSIEGNPSGIETDYNETSEKFEVKALGPWEVIVKDEGADWLRAEPSEGEGDGSFEIEIDENNGDEPREAEVAFFLNNQEQPQLFMVNQGDNVPFIDVDDDEIKISGKAKEFTINIEANVEWSYSLEDDSWLSEEKLTDNKITFLPEKNLEEERSVVLTLTSTDRGDIEKEVKITQSSESIILEEDFSWLDYGSAIFYDYPDEKRMDLWSDEELDHGWTSTKNPGSDDQQLVYARPGFVKLGKTNFGSDLISPKLSQLEEPTDVLVTFKANPYQTKAGTRDDNKLYVSAEGDGEVDNDSFTIDNWPDYDDDPESTKAWESEDAVYSFKIKDATANTRIKWLAGALDLRDIGDGKNRIFIDDVKVEVITGD